MSITTKDLARLCGVSRTTVHRALNDAGRINDETKQRILKTARENGYRPDLLARGLVKGRTHYFGIVVLDISNGHFTQMLDSAGRAAHERGYFTNICLHDNDPDIERELLVRLTDYRVDGILLSSISCETDYSSFIKELGLPVVTTDNPISEEIPYIGIDNESAMYEMATCAAEKGYRRIVFVCPSLSDERRNVTVHKLRFLGFERSQREHRSLEYIVMKDAVFLEKCKKLLIEGKKKTAFLCAADIFALELKEMLAEDGLHAGRDYGLAGFDNIDMLSHITPRLTTIDNRAADIGTEAVALLDLMSNGQKASMRTILPYRLIEGETL